MKNFFEPQAIALIGASENENKVGGILVKKLINLKENLILVNPNRDFIKGIRVYKKITEFAGKIDLAVIAVPSDFVYSVLEDCAKKGIKDVIIISAGFSEAGKKEEEEKLNALARENKIRILGPNCFGVCNPYTNLDTTFSAAFPEKGSVAFVSQSGALWSFISDFSIGKFGLSGFASLGNMVDLEFSDFIEYFSKDEKTKSIVLYIEKLKNGKRFIDVCKKCKKKIFAVKAGSSKEGATAAVSHTGSLATDFAIYRGAFKQAGIKLCNSLEEAFEKASGKILIENKNKTLKIKNYGKKVFVITNAGGAGALASDCLSNTGFDVVQIPDFKNPLDIFGTARSEDYTLVFEKIENEDFYDFIVAITTSQSMTDSDRIAEKIVEFSKTTNKKIIALFLGNKTVKKALEILQENNIPCINTLEEFRRNLN